MRLKRTILLAAVCLASLGACARKESSGAGGGDVSHFPSKPITILAHTDAGSSTDIFARELARAVEPVLGQPVVVVNRPGGGGATQMAQLKSSHPDGYTLGVNTSTQLTAMATTLKGTYKWEDFSWITLNQLDPYVIVVKADSPYKTIGDLVAASKQGKNFKIGGYGTVGSAHNIAFAMLGESAKIDYTWVAYPGGQQAMTALLGDHLDVVNTNPGPVMQFAEAGRVRVLGVFAKERIATFPDAKTYAEQGYDLDTSWTQIRGLYGPKGIPMDIQKKLADAMFKGMQDKRFQEYMKNTAQEAGNLGPDKYPDFIAKQDATGKDWLKKLGMQQ